MSTSEFNHILEELNFFDEWEERYIYIISLGHKLPAFPTDCKDDAHKVDGCVSQVWLKCRTEGTGDDRRLKFLGDSDAFIVKGLVAILFSLYDGRACDEILSTDAEAAFKKLGLEQHISPNRRNGFFSMVGRIHAYAKEHA